ncbi:hypothetical protein NYG90_05930 [Helicobacter sp. XJK30-2]|uniref:Uncharacterized protein n=1 Tax=Helicobacter zhangjianzhongii TaxID=2974574 RepID=A0ACC6FSP3_9HELI|nr:hypothetical protein [Helicobacter sp. XJK30-2]MDL0082213.1 hypothetical protein [Helicobacter sp. XJK30-2]
MKRVFGFGVVFMLYVLGFFLLLGSAWLKQNFEIESFEQILFHLRFPLLDTDSAIAWYFIKAVVLPSVSFAMLMSFAPSFVRFLRAHKEARLGLWLGFGASFVGFVLFVLVREPSFLATLAVWCYHLASACCCLVLPQALLWCMGLGHIGFLVA